MAQEDAENRGATFGLDCSTARRARSFQPMAPSPAQSKWIKGRAAVAARSLIRWQHASDKVVKRWQDDLLISIMECDANSLSTVLDNETHGKKALNAVLQRKLIGGQPCFLLDEQVYPREGALREVLGGQFEFEAEQRREMLSAWLEMIGARTGDTMLHIVLRLNGADEDAKAACAVQLLGRGVDWEKVNGDNALCSMVDPPAFKRAFFHDLPRFRVWEQGENAKKEEERKLERVRNATKRRKEEQQAVLDKRRAAWAAVRAKAKEDMKREAERDRFHQRLQGALAKLERREQKMAKANPGWVEFISDLQKMPERAERWMRDNKWL